MKKLLIIAAMASSFAVTGLHAAVEGGVNIGSDAIATGIVGGSNTNSADGNGSVAVNRIGSVSGNVDIGSVAAATGLVGYNNVNLATGQDTVACNEIGSITSGTECQR